MTIMYDGVTNMYSFEMNKRPINLVYLKPKQINEEQLKLKKEKMVENESLYIKGTFFANKVLLGFDDDVILWLGTDLLKLEDVSHDTYSRSNLFKQGRTVRTKSGPNLTLKCLLTSFAKSNISLKPHIKKS
jgi:hypothetical protein